MNKILTITKREFKAYFTSPIAYIYLTTFLVLTNWLFFRAFFVLEQANMRPFFELMPWIFLFFIPAVSMSKWAEEKKSGTIELLLTLPIKDGDVVLAKFFASLGLVLTALILTLPLPLTIALVGDLDMGPVIGGYLGLLFLGSAYLAIGLFISSLTENQIIAFILAVILSFLFFIFGEPIFTSAVPDVLLPFFRYLGLGIHFESIGRGVVDSRDLIYYLSIIGFFLWLNLKTIQARHLR
jgi:ABC-2 type transport system permease protein